jgi:hypothetical protein
MRQIEPNLKFKITNLQFTMAFSQPNPASTWVAFDYKLPHYAGEAILQVLDMKGNWVTTFTLTSKQGQKVWDVRDIQKGAYLYVLQVGNLRKSGKLIVE